MKPWTKTRTRRSFGLWRFIQLRVSAAEVTGSTEIVVKSFNGSGGSFFGHCTWPTLRLAAGGMETVTASTFRPVPRSPPNSTALSSAGARVVATSRLTGVVPCTTCPVGVITPTGRPPQLARKVNKVTKATSLAAIPILQDRARLFSQQI
ncbi:hypothetical protein [Agrobacterium cavarae]|uniref:hypothetical protein n=1 Tax=Agrobacterium cavarae TaxID=2528239 RepID=UPI003D06B9A5